MESPKKKIIIWGASGHSIVVADIIRLENKYQLAGFLEDVDTKNHRDELMNLPVYHGRENLDNFLRKGINTIIFGFSNINAREVLSELVLSKGFTLGTAIHPKSIISDDIFIREGTVVAAGVVINPRTSIGRNVILNTSCTIDHDCMIQAGSHIKPGVNLAGNVKVGKNSWIGIGSTVIENIDIGCGVTIGAGATVTKSIPDHVVAFGVPAEIKRTIVNDQY